MTVEEAFAEMKRRGWGYAKSAHWIAIGPITNPNYTEDGEMPRIEVYGMDTDPVRALEKAIEVEERKNVTH